MTERVKPIPDGYRTVTPYLKADDASAILSFLERAFGATILQRALGPDGKVMHAEARIGDSMVMLADANDQWPAAPATLYLYVEDVDSVYRQAIEAGARSILEPQDMFYGDRSGGITDPAGNQWWIATHVEDVTLAEMDRRRAEQAQQAGSSG